MSKTYKIKLIIVFFFSFVLLACKNLKVGKNEKLKFPAGKWKAISLQNQEGTILFNSHKNYDVDLYVENKLIVTVEDNILSGYLIDRSNDSIKMA